jgi:hypothetical protein
MPFGQRLSHAAGGGHKRRNGTAGGYSHFRSDRIAMTDPCDQKWL